MQEVDICFSLDSNYVEQFCVSAVSILKNSLENEKINFYILDGGLTKNDKDVIQQLKNIKDFTIQYLQVNNDDFNSCPMLKDKDEKYKNYHVSKPTYYRFKLPTLLTNLDKILYLDCDVIVRSSLSDLYNKNLKDKACCMCLDVESKKEAKRLGLKQYFNAGIILINLAYWRKNNIESKLFDYAKNNVDKILWQDQDVINCVLNEKIEKISNKWNYQYFLYDEIKEKELYDCVILHLAGRFKPWLIPFNHFVYDAYYCYLCLTPYKNRILEYKEKSSGKYLKNNIGGTNTNIQNLVFDNDIQKIYEEITKSYAYTTETKDFLTKQIDLKTEQVGKNVNSQLESITNSIDQNKNITNKETDEKISKVYEEITKNYEYTNEIRDNLTFKIDENNKQLTTELQLQEENANKNISATQEVIEFKTDEKISKVYEEITKNYEYTNEIRDNLASKIEENNKQLTTELQLQEENTNKNISATQDVLEFKTDEKISKVYEEITKNYEYTNEIRDNLTSKINEENQNINNSNAQTDEKISKVYEEITKNYEYTNEIRDNLTSKINEENQNINNSNAQADEKISKVYEEITKNYEYTNNIRDNLNVEISNKVNEVSYNLTSKIDEETSKNQNYISEVKLDTENKISKLNENISDKDREQTRQNDLKNSEIYSYTNSELLKLLNRLNSYDKNLQEKIELKSFDAYKWFEENKNEINRLKEVLNSKTDIELLTNIENKLLKIEENHQKQMENILLTFDDKLNEQRLKYENKLINMEKLINKLEEKYNYDKKSFFRKMVDKIKKR